MRFFSILIALVLVSFSLPSHSQSSITGEIRFADLRKNHPDSTEYKVEYNNSYAKTLLYGAELSVKQDSDQGAVGSKFSLKVGPVLPELKGFKPNIYAELGKNFKQNYNYEFWAAGAKLSHILFGPVSVSLGFRHRRALHSVLFRENRMNIGLTYAVSKEFEIGAQYYRSRSGGNNIDAVGILVTHKFQ